MSMSISEMVDPQKGSHRVVGQERKTRQNEFRARFVAKGNCIIALDLKVRLRKNEKAH